MSKLTVCLNLRRAGLGALAVAASVLVTAQATAAQTTTSSRYGWPVKPFDRQHPIRGAFGDPRTLVRYQPFGITRPLDGGAHSFHNGVDIVAKRGAPVYPVVSGKVVVARARRIIVDAGHGRTFQY